MRKNIKTLVEKELQQCYGPTCDFHPSLKFSPTGFTWKELQEYRERNIRRMFASKGILDVTAQMLLDKPIPTYKHYKKITKTVVKR